MTGFTPVLTLRLQLAKAPVNLADSFGFDSKPAFEALVIEPFLHGDVRAGVAQTNIVVKVGALLTGQRPDRSRVPYRVP